MEATRVDRPLCTVLIVDDEALVRDGIAGLLEASGQFVIVDRLGRGDDAPEAARKGTPDIMILDIEMPGRSAFDAARAVRSASPSTRIVFLSGHVHRRFVREAVEIGASAYVTKLESGPAILEALERVRRGECVWPEMDVAGERLGASVDRLTSRELEVLKYISRGLSTREMAQVMFLSPRTVERHVERLMSRLGIRDRLRLALYAFSEGLAVSPRMISRETELHEVAAAC